MAKKRSKFGMMIHEIAKLSAQLEADIAELREAIEQERDGRRRRAYTAQLDAIIAGKDVPNKARSGWDYTKWMIEAESLKAAACLYRQAGLLIKAHECELAAGKGTSEAPRLR